VALEAPRTTHTWRVVFGCGLLLWVVSTVTLVVTDDEIVLPSVVISGSFLVPVTAIFWLVDHRHRTELHPRRLLVAFFLAGVLGMLAAAALETWLLPERELPNLWVGFIEEAAKAIGLVAVARGLPQYTVRDGVLLGATVGLGFGAFESAGYTLTYGLQSGALSVHALISEEVLRAVIAPFGHGVWTGLVGAALFAGARGGRLRLTGGVVAAYVTASLLHALWDGAAIAATVVTVLATGDEFEREALRAWDFPSPSSLDAHLLYGAVQWGMMIVVAIAGLALVRRRWRAAAPAPDG
jgi:RsiW-degrading membrane proteinase PrsW (M82 family)